MQAKKKQEEEERKLAEEEAEKQKQLELQMEGLNINLNYKPKYGQDPALFNQMYMDYIANLGSETTPANTTADSRPISQQS